MLEAQLRHDTPAGTTRLSPITQELYQHLIASTEATRLTESCLQLARHFVGFERLTVPAQNEFARMRAVLDDAATQRAAMEMIPCSGRIAEPVMTLEVRIPISPRPAWLNRTRLIMASFREFYPDTIFRISVGTHQAPTVADVATVEAQLGQTGTLGFRRPHERMGRHTFRIPRYHERPFPSSHHRRPRDDFPRC